MFSARSRAGSSAADDFREPDNFIRVGDLLAALQSKARKER